LARCGPRLALPDAIRREAHAEIWDGESSLFCAAGAFPGCAISSGESWRGLSRAVDTDAAQDAAQNSLARGCLAPIFSVPTRCRAIAHDRRGFGRPYPRKEYHYDVFADELATLTEPLKLSDLMLTAHSMGKQGYPQLIEQSASRRQGLPGFTRPSRENRRSALKTHGSDDQGRHLAPSRLRWRLILMNFYWILQLPVSFAVTGFAGQPSESGGSYADKSSS